MYVNGFIVQDMDKENPLFNILNPETRDKIFSKYKSDYIMGYDVWPLWGKKEYKKLNDYLDNLWFAIEQPYKMEVISDISLLHKYIECCGREKTNIRVLLICSDRETPFIQKEQLKNLHLRFLGYDYIESSTRYSYTLGNLYGGDYLNTHSDNINQYGLFNDMEKLQMYINDLHKIYNTEEFLEMFDMCAAKIYQLII